MRGFVVWGRGIKAEEGARDKGGSCCAHNPNTGIHIVLALFGHVALCDACLCVFSSQHFGHGVLKYD